MATINDIGGDQPLNAPPLGGPSGWAAAVRDYLLGHDTALTGLTAAGVLTPRAGFADLGAGYAGLYCTRAGNVVTLEGTIKPTADKPLTAGTPLFVADIPAGFRPLHSIITPVLLALTNNLTTMKAARITVDTAGAVQLNPAATETWATTGYLTLTATYRAA